MTWGEHFRAPGAFRRALPSPAADLLGRAHVQRSNLALAELARMEHFVSTGTGSPRVFWSCPAPAAAAVVVKEPTSRQLAGVDASPRRSQHAGTLWQLRLVSSVGDPWSALAGASQWVGAQPGALLLRCQEQVTQRHQRAAVLAASQTASARAGHVNYEHDGDVRCRPARRSSPPVPLRQQWHPAGGGRAARRHRGASWRVPTSTGSTRCDGCLSWSPTRKTAAPTALPGRLRLPSTTATSRLRSGRSVWRPLPRRWSASTPSERPTTSSRLHPLSQRRGQVYGTLATRVTAGPLRRGSSPARRRNRSSASFVPCGCTATPAPHKAAVMPLEKMSINC